MTRYRNALRPAASYYLRFQTCSTAFVDSACYEFARLRLLHRAAAHGVQLHAFAILPRELFLLGSAAGHEAVLSLLGSLVTSYRDYFNLRFRRYQEKMTAPVKIAELQDYRSVLACQKFLDTEAVRQLDITHPGRFHWSSYSYYAFGGAPRLLVPHPALGQLVGAGGDRPAAYREFIAREFEPAFVRYLAMRLRHGIAINSSLRRGHAA